MTAGKMKGLLFMHRDLENFEHVSKEKQVGHFNNPGLMVGNWRIVHVSCGEAIYFLRNERFDSLELQTILFS